MKLTVHHFHLAICAALLFAQLATSLDISTLPTVANTHQSKKIEVQEQMAEFSYRVLINDHYHLHCHPSTTYYRVKKKRRQDEEEATEEANEGTNQMNLACPIISKVAPVEAPPPPYVQRAEVDVGFAGDQQLRLLQRQTIKWAAVGGNLSLMALYRKNPRTLESCFLTSGFFEVGVAIGRQALESSAPPTPTPLVICRSAVEPFRLGLLSMWHGGGLCTLLELPQNDEKHSKTNRTTASFRTYLDEPIQLAVKQQPELNYSWAEMSLSGVASGHWAAPPNAVEVEIGQSYWHGKGAGFSRDTRPLYIARLTVNASFTTVIGLFGGVKLPLLKVGKESKLELLVENEAHFQVQLRLSGYLNPENVLAKWWDETLNCKLKIGIKSTSSSAKEGEVSLVD